MSAYEAINDVLVVKTVKNDNFKSQMLECEVIETTEQTKELQSRTVYAQRSKVFDLAGEEEEAQTASGILLAGKKAYAVVRLEDIYAIKK